MAGGAGALRPEENFLPVGNVALHGDQLGQGRQRLPKPLRCGEELGRSRADFLPTNTAQGVASGKVEVGPQFPGLCGLDERSGTGLGLSQAVDCSCTEGERLFVVFDGIQQDRFALGQLCVGQSLSGGQCGLGIVAGDRGADELEPGLSEGQSHRLDPGGVLRVSLSKSNQLRLVSLELEVADDLNERRFALRRFENTQDNFLERRIRLDIEILQPLERLQLDACLGGRFDWPSGGQSNCDD